MKTISKEIEDRINEVFDTREGSIQVTYAYDYDYESLSDDDVADAEIKFNDRAWKSLLKAAKLKRNENASSQPNPIEWKWSGCEEGGLTVWVNTKDAALNLARAGYAIEIL